MTKSEREERRWEWRDRVTAWHESGLSVAAFCRDRGLPVWQLFYWVKRIEELDSAGDGGFARVSSPGSGLRLSLPGGLRLDVDPDFDAATLRRFLQAVSVPC